MPGGGTKLGTTPNKAGAFCLDITRLIRRAGQVQTGVDRVELAYLRWCCSLDRPVFALLRTRLGYVLLDRRGMQIALTHLRDHAWGTASLLSRLRLGRPGLRERAESTLRRHAIARAVPQRLTGMLRARLPGEITYFNIGHSNLTERVLRSFRAMPGAQIAVMLHDTIPLDFPQYQRSGSVESFRAKLARVSRYADVILCNSHQTAEDVTRHLSPLGPVPRLIVAHLGLDVPQVPKVAQLPDVPEPFFMMLGTIEPRKNHALMLDLWENWPAHPKAQKQPYLVICGRRGWNSEPLFARLQAAQKRGLPILEFNDLEDGPLFALMQRARAVLFPSEAEGFGLPAAEALALGVPVICGDLAIHREVLGALPVYVEDSTPYAWHEAISEVLHQDSPDMAQAGTQQPAFKAPNWDTHFNLVLKEMD